MNTNLARGTVPSFGAEWCCDEAFSTKEGRFPLGWVILPIFAMSGVLWAAILAPFI